jgi:hypothetical protein
MTNPAFIHLTTIHGYTYHLKTQLTPVFVSVIFFCILSPTGSTSPSNLVVGEWGCAVEILGRNVLQDSECHELRTPCVDPTEHIMIHK